MDLAGLIAGEKARRVEEAGGAAMLIVTDDHEPYVPLGTPADDSILIPVVSIGKRAGAALLANAGCEQGERPCPAVISIRYQSKMLEKPRKIGKCATLATETSADLHLIRRFKRLVRKHIKHFAKQWAQVGEWDNGYCVCVGTMRHATAHK